MKITVPIFCLLLTVGAETNRGFGQNLSGTPCLMPQNAAELRGFAGYPGKIQEWESQIIPYYFEEGISNDIIEGFKEVVTAFETSTNLCLVPRRQEDKAVLIKKTFGAFSYADLSENTIYLHSNANFLALHEVCHLLGMAHEHQRPQRDSFVEVFWENIDPSFKYAFEELLGNSGSISTQSYDYASIMHYTPYIFSKNGLPTIRRKTGDAFNMGGIDLSPLDIKLLNSAYPKQINCKQIKEARPPLAAFEIADQEVCVFEPVLIKNQSQDADSYEWTAENGRPDSVGRGKDFEVYFSTPGIYRIDLKADNIFGSSHTTKLLKVKACNGTAVSMFFPNPTKGKLTCVLSVVLPDEFEVRIFAANGQLVHQSVKYRDFDGQNTLKLDFSEGLADGAYLLELGMHGQTIVEPFVLARN